MVKGMILKLKEKPKLREVVPTKKLDPLIYWTTLLILVIANIAASIALMPLLLFSSSFNFYLMIALVAIFFGYIFNMLITRIENVDPHHHLFAAFFIPAFAVINMVIMSNSTAGIARIIGLQSEKDPLVTSSFYLLFFIFPHVLHIIRKKIYG
jgi:hypothetical protein